MEGEEGAAALVGGAAGMVQGAVAFVGGCVGTATSLFTSRALHKRFTKKIEILRSSRIKESIMRMACNYVHFGKIFRLLQQPLLIVIKFV